MLKKNIVMYSAVAILLVISIVSAQKITSSSVPVYVPSVSFSLLPTVVIDAGHGGVDGGSVGIDGTVEKEINLRIALKLRDILELYGFETVMIRDEDKSIHNDDAETIRDMKISDLHNRLNIINSTENCISISIHQNYFEQSKYSGTQVFYSSNNENSQVLAQIIQQTVVDSLQNDNTRQIKSADKTLYLLHNSEKPSVMIECGFLSNPNELALLKTEDYQKQMAMSIANGILKYTEKINSGE